MNGPPARSARARIAASFVLPARTSPRASLWIAGYRTLHMPFAAVGTARRYRVSLDADDASVVCVGRRQAFRQLLTRVFDGRAQLEEVGPGRPLWNPRRPWPENAALVAVEVHPFFARRFRAAGWLICPERVRWQGPLSEMPPAQPSNSLREDLRRVKARGYTLEVSTGSTHDWTQFEQQMLLPYAQRRFGQEARRPAPGLRREAAKRGKLLFLRHQGRRIAGMYMLCNGSEAWFVALGVSGGDVDLMRDGAIAGLYALGIDWARRIGMRRFDASSTFAFELDGLARYKRKWGMSPVPEPLTPLIAMRVDPTHEALRLAIEREPFWIESADRGLEIYRGR